jgi:FixJ family two-component response regulator
LPVIVLTALGEGPMVARARKHKVDATLFKPKASFEDVLRAVESATATTTRPAD